MFQPRATSRLAIVTLLLVAPAIAGTGDPAPDPVDPAEAVSFELDVMSFNVRTSRADDSGDRWMFRREMFLAMLRDESPDIIGLQEPPISQLTEIEKALPRYSRIGVGAKDGLEGGVINAILYDKERFRAADQGTFWLSDTPDVAGSMRRGSRHARTCTWVKLVESGSGRSLFVYNLHLVHNVERSRQKSVTQLLGHIDAGVTDEPVIILGDFNIGAGEATIRMLDDRPADAPHHFLDTFHLLFPDAENAGTLHRFTGKQDGERVDFIFVTDDVGVLDAGIVRHSSEGRYPSDHFPVTARLRIP